MVCLTKVKYIVLISQLSAIILIFSVKAIVIRTFEAADVDGGPQRV